CLYDTHDVTAMLREGENALGLILGNGMYNVVGGRYAKYTGSMGPQKAIAHVRLEYADGSHEIVGTDERWQVTTGPITFSCVFGGEDHDARLEASGWDAAGFNASAWSPARPCDGPGGALKGTAHAAPPIRAFDVLKPVAQRELKPGVTVYDLGQNASIMPRLAVTGPAGAIVRVTPSELVRADGSIDRRSCGNKPAFWQYTLRGSGGGDASGGSAGGGGAGGGGGSAGGGGGARETWFPKFFYHGSRYLQVECLGPDGKPLPMDVSIEGVVVHSSAEPVGDFACSSDLFNRTRELVRWAQRSNIVSIITDCPHRERLGWLEQYHLNGPSLRYEWGLAPLYTKGLGDMADAQTPDGLVPDIAPEFTVFRGGFRDSPEWGSAVVIAAWQQYLFEGDADLLRRHYGAMTRYVDYLSRKAKDNLLNHGLGDWYDLGPNKPGASQLTPIMLTATATYYQDLATMAQVADVLGKLDDAASYRERAADVRRAFNAKLFDAGKGRYATGSQTAQAMPLVLDLVEPQNRQAVIDALVRDIRDRGNALTAGDVGHYYLLRALAGAGRSDVVFDMHSAADKPGYGLILSRGATSLTEAWDAGETSSQNHFMLGHIVEWFYRDLAGIQPTAGGPGFARITIRPQVVGDLTSAKARYRSIRGPIESAWKRDGERLTLEVSVPPGSTATVHVPTIDPAGVTEGGGPADKADGVRRAGEAGGAAVFDVQSGRYTFAARFDATRAGATTGAGANADRSR
ncbi:MAG TPA: family 78 glycoside hydrolase catalytic domain, partial [Tepidisphaeraceae bacterium]|nr:family 78 glycoside hydrolase catalytic domain [Tepidisphaeraceae bacterium]